MSSTRHMLVQELQKHNYDISELLLTPLQFGVPNSRLRYYLLAKALPLRFIHNTCTTPSTAILRHIPGQGQSWIGSRDKGVETETHNTLTRYLCIRDKSAPDQYLVPDRILVKWGRLFDIVKPSSSRTCCFTRGKPFCLV